MPMYIFTCFKVPEAICNKMDAISRAFWWGHDLGEKKMHLVSWDKVCKPKREGGLGLRKFGLMNKSMLAKQLWRISQISKTFKAKYFPNTSIHECSSKPHHSWFWRAIINQKKKHSKWKKMDYRFGYKYPSQSLYLVPLSTTTAKPT